MKKYIDICVLLLNQFALVHKLPAFIFSFYPTYNINYSHYRLSLSLLLTAQKRIQVNVELTDLGGTLKCTITLSMY